MPFPIFQYTARGGCPTMLCLKIVEAAESTLRNQTQETVFLPVVSRQPRDTLGRTPSHHVMHRTLLHSGTAHQKAIASAPVAEATLR
eukprot:1297409-Rhodomonas_salina.1